MKKAICPTVIVACLGMPLTASCAEWTLTGQGEQAVVTDCADCEEDIGIMLQCQGPGMAAKLLVMAQAQEKEPSGPLVFSVDGQEFNYEPQAEFFGLVGYVPWITLPISDPLKEALINGERLSVVYEGGGIEYSLEGLPKTLQTFASTCDWGEQIPAPIDRDSESGIEQPLQPQPQSSEPSLEDRTDEGTLQPEQDPETGPQSDLEDDERPVAPADQEPLSLSFPYDTHSEGGRVRAGPGIETDQIGSTTKMAPITLLEEVPDSDFDGYPWFRIRYSKGVGFQWGGIICHPGDVNIPGTHGECTQ